MPKHRHIVTVRDPRDSVWQSVVERVAKREAQQAAVAHRAATAMQAPAPSAPSALQAHLDTMVEAANAQVFDRDELAQGRIPESFALAPQGAARSLGGVAATPMVSGLESAKRCASLSLQIAKAKVFGTDGQVQVLQNAFDFNVCDPFWVKCVNEYVTHFQLNGDKIPYRAGLDNLLPTPVSANATIALFGDWGTGTQDALDLLQQIKGFKPDILMHLGDVYYSGTQDEMQERFLDVCESVFGASMPTRFSLSGNHDMYSGGEGYYWLVDQLDQRASYFAIQNDDWLFIAMDTGVHDFDPIQGGSSATFLMSSEASWVNQLVANKGNKKVVFLSHHPLFSAYDPIGGSSLNPVLLSQIQDSLPQVTAWFWGHEHRLGVYDPFQNLQRGRCLGHAAVPVFADGTGDPPKLAGVPVFHQNGKPLDMGAADGIFKHGFAIMTLNGQSANVSYYRQGDTDPLWQESY
ncbi:Calcineurin-like phosphoesterase [Singulisphaera sp. GP187]|uniref:metallophosphoesterase family protein n=1 Tax=Singulisphaera sp. GP187 TaxID=1882752 RepID=UPI00092788B4|nr:metallophosphoesterase [Singulisphaera sp. GP187]SIO66691.1 Calcineurin-like phosphoesterase [Singulisphaera sp. GP187]